MSTNATRAVLVPRLAQAWSVALDDDVAGRSVASEVVEDERGLALEQDSVVD